MIRVAVVEDDLNAAEMLVDYIRQFQESDGVEFQIDTFSGGAVFLENLFQGYSIIFLDIQMAPLDGIQTAREIRAIDENVCIIFVTSVASYALQGYEVNAMDFMVKPISYANFYNRLKKALRIVALNSSVQSIPLKFSGDIKIVRSDEITYIETAGAYVDFHTLYGISHMRGPLKNFEAELNQYGFLRCNHCFLVNPRYITEISGDTVVVNGDCLKISRGKKKGFVNGLTEYLGGRL